MERVQIKVNETTLVIVDSCNKRGRDGVVFAEVIPKCSEVEAKLYDAHQWNDEVMLNSRLIDVSGSISKVEYGTFGKKFIVRVLDLIYRGSEVGDS